MTKQLDTQSLERKLARGAGISEAAAEAGMTEEEARAYLEKRKKEGEEADDMAFFFLSNECIKIGVDALGDAITNRQDKVSESFGPAGGHRYADWHITSAQALLKAGLEGRKLLERKAAAEKAAKQLDRGLDLFDRAKSAWKFKGDT